MFHNDRLNIRREKNVFTVAYANLHQRYTNDLFDLHLNLYFEIESSKEYLQMLCAPYSFLDSYQGQCDCFCQCHHVLQSKLSCQIPTTIKIINTTTR